MNRRSLLASILGAFVAPKVAAAAPTFASGGLAGPTTALIGEPWALHQETLPLNAAALDAALKRSWDKWRVEPREVWFYATADEAAALGALEADIISLREAAE